MIRSFVQSCCVILCVNNQQPSGKREKSVQLEERERRTTTSDDWCCYAIPKAALTDRYARRFAEGWTRWNGLEVSDQIKDGVEGLFAQCYHEEGDERRASNLRRNYCGFARNHAVLRDSEIYSRHCD